MGKSHVGNGKFCGGIWYDVDLGRKDVWLEILKIIIEGGHKGWLSIIEW